MFLGKSFIITRKSYGDDEHSLSKTEESNGSVKSGQEKSAVEEKKIQQYLRLPQTAGIRIEAKRIVSGKKLNKMNGKNSNTKKYANQHGIRRIGVEQPSKSKTRS